MLEALRDGRTNADIAIELGLSVNTVKYHVANMLVKLDLHSRDELSGWKPRPGRGLWAGAPIRVLFVIGASFAGAAVVAGGILFAVQRSASGSGVDGPPIAYVSPFSNTGSNLFSVQPGSAPQQLTHQGSSYVFSPEWSPDGKSLAYLNVPEADVPLKAGTSSVASLTLLDAVTGEVHDLAENASTLPAVALLQSPFWTADGSLIVFETQDFIVSSIKPDATAQQDLELGCLSPAWSSDGRMTACVVPGPAGNAVLVLQGTQRTPPSGSAVRRELPGNGVPSGPQFSHDDRWLAWSDASTNGSEHIFVSLLDGQYPSGDLRPTDIGPGYDPRWSPTGDQLAFSSGQSPWMLPMIGLPAGSASDGKVFVYDASSKHLANLTHSNASNLFPAWSPDGNQIAFVSENDVWVMDADGSHPRRVTDDGAPKLMLAWAPG